MEAHDLIANKTCLEPCLSSFDNIIEEVSNSNPVSARGTHVAHEDCGVRRINITRVSDFDLVGCSFQLLSLLLLPPNLIICRVIL